MLWTVPTGDALLFNMLHLLFFDQVRKLDPSQIETASAPRYQSLWR